MHCNWLGLHPTEVDSLGQGQIGEMEKVMAAGKGREIQGSAWGGQPDTIPKRTCPCLL